MTDIFTSNNIDLSPESSCMVFRLTLLANENVRSIGQGKFQSRIYKGLNLTAVKLKTIQVIKLPLLEASAKQDTA
jgi:hypothetical protein